LAGRGRGKIRSLEKGKKAILLERKISPKVPAEKRGEKRDPFPLKGEEGRELRSEEEGGNFAMTPQSKGEKARETFREALPYMKKNTLHRRRVGFLDEGSQGFSGGAEIFFLSRKREKRNSRGGNKKKPSMKREKGWAKERGRETVLKEKGGSFPPP